MRNLSLLLFLAACGPKTTLQEPVESAPAPEPEVPAASQDGEVVEQSDAAAESAWGELPVAEASTPLPPTAEELRAQSDEKLQQAAGLLTTRRDSDASRAVELLREITGEYPDNALAYYNLGVAYQVLGQNGDARKAYLRSTDIYPGLGDAWLNLGAMRRAQGDNQRAMQYYRAGLRDDPENMDLRGALVNVLRAQGQYELALSQVKKALEINANSLEIYNELSMIYLAEAEAGIDEPTKLALAQFYLERAKKKEGGDQHPRVQCNLGRVYEMRGFLGQAAVTYEEALGLDPDMVQCALYLTAIYLDSRNYLDAIPLLERAAGLEPENAAIHLNLGIAYRGAKRYDEAKREYEKVLELQPENPEPYLNLAILTGDYLKQFDDAVTLYETYRDNGGAQADRVDGYVAATLKEKKRIEREERRRRRAEEREKERQERQQRLEEAERQRALEEQQQALEAPQSAPVSEPATGPEGPAPAPVAPEPAPEQPAPEPAPEQPAPEPAPAEQEEENPWG